jgi:hypothetical protein
MPPPHRPTVPHAHSREPWPLTAPHAPDCRALTPALPPCVSVMIRGGTQAPPTSLIGKVWSPATAATETCCMHTAKPARDCQGARRIQGTRAGDRGRTADGRIGDPPRRPATPTKSMSTLTIALVTSDREARLHDFKRMIEDTCAERSASRQQAKRPARGRESVQDGANAGAEDTEGVERCGAAGRTRKRGRR